MTLIVLLILAAVSLNAVFSEKGIFSRAEKAGNKYNEAKAREVLETVLLADGQYEKNTNPKYNQDDFLDDLITTQIPDSRIIEGTDIVVIEEKYAYELDRSVPKIGTSGNNGYLGNPKDLVFPTVNGTFQLENYNQNASITATALEEKNGINKIEIWFGGEKIKEYTYDNVKTQVTTNPALPVYRNGTYIVKAYGNLSASTTVTVVGIVPAVTFSPDGNVEWKKQHSTTVTVDETYTKVVSMKYLWTKSQVAPEETEFTDTQACINNGTISGGNDTMTGTYYLWILLTTNAGKTRCSSAGFNFDNEGPNIKTFTYIPLSETTYNLVSKAEDVYSKIGKYEFYINGKCVFKKNTEEEVCTTSDFNEVKSYNTNYEIRVYDSLGNQNSSKLTNNNNVQIWKKFQLIKNVSFTLEELGSQSKGYFGGLNSMVGYPWSNSKQIVTDGDDNWKFENEGIGGIEEAIRKGGTVYQWRATTLMTKFWGYPASTSPDISYYQDYSVTRVETPTKGKFIQLENYTKNNKPSIGANEDGWYEIEGNLI